MYPAQQREHKSILTSYFLLALCWLDLNPRSCFFFLNNDLTLTQTCLKAITCIKDMTDRRGSALLCSVGSNFSLCHHDFRHEVFTQLIRQTNFFQTFKIQIKLQEISLWNFVNHQKWSCLAELDNKSVVEFSRVLFWAAYQQLSQILKLYSKKYFRQLIKLQFAGQPKHRGTFLMVCRNFTFVTEQ